MTCRELPGAGLGPTPDNMNKCLHTELSSHEETRSEFNPGTAVIKLGIDVHQEHYVVVVQEGGGNPKPAQRFKKEAFLCWVAKLKQKSGAEMHAVYEACGDTYRTAGAIADELNRTHGAGCDADTIASVVARFCDEDLMIDEDGRYLSLALPVNVNW